MLGKSKFAKALLSWQENGGSLRDLTTAAEAEASGLDADPAFSLRLAKVVPPIQQQAIRRPA